MCLGIPGRIESIDRAAPPLMGQVSFGGVNRAVRLEHVPDARVGDDVIAHVGFALSRLDEAEAERVFSMLEALAHAGTPGSGRDDEVR